MKLPWRTHTAKTVVEADEARSDAGPRVELHRSPGLEAVVGGCDARGVGRVLDFGPALPENIEYLAGFASHIRVADFFRDSDKSSAATTMLRNLDPKREGGFDLILFWDVFDYLNEDVGTALVDVVVPLCAPSARCLVMASAADTVPVLPRRFRVADASHLRYEWTSSEEMGITQLTPATLGRVLSGFSIEHAFVLRNGLREFVAVRDAES